MKNVLEMRRLDGIEVTSVYDILVLSEMVAYDYLVLGPRYLTVFSQLGVQKGRIIKSITAISTFFDSHSAELI